MAVLGSKQTCPSPETKLSPRAVTHCLYLEQEPVAAGEMTLRESQNSRVGGTLGVTRDGKTNVREIKTVTVL